MPRFPSATPAAAGLALVFGAACADRLPTGAGDGAARPPGGALLSTEEMQDPNGIIVALKALGPDRTVPEDVAAAVDAQGARITSFDPDSRLVVVAGAKDQLALAEQPSTDFLAPNAEAVEHADQSGAALYASLQQNLPRINAPAAWADASDGTGVLVCIIDSGVDDSHPDMAGLVVGDTNVVNLAPSGADGRGHGTHVASTVVTNGIGAASVAPGARLLNARTFDNAGGGATTARIVAAIRWCGRKGAHVINMSLGFSGGVLPTSPDIPLLQAAIDEVRTGSNPDGAGTGGTLTVASAGNDAARIPSAFRVWVPAQLASVIAVGATQRTGDTRPGFSNRGRAVSIYAPGGDILGVCSTFSATNNNCLGGPRSAVNGAPYMRISGTSMAAPHIAGVAAVVYSAYGGVRSPENAAKVRSCVLGRTVPGIVPQLPDRPGNRTDVRLAQTGRAAGSPACPL